MILCLDSHCKCLLLKKIIFTVAAAATAIPQCCAIHTLTHVCQTHKLNSGRHCHIEIYYAENVCAHKRHPIEAHKTQTQTIEIKLYVSVCVHTIRIKYEKEEENETTREPKQVEAGQSETIRTNCIYTLWAIEQHRIKFCVSLSSQQNAAQPEL